MPHETQQSALPAVPRARRGGDMGPGDRGRGERGHGDRGRGERGAKLTWAVAAVIGAAMLSAGCGAMSTTKHGHLLGASDLQQVQPGMTQEQVRLALGSPNTASPLGNSAYYYISTTREQRPFEGSVITDRQVVAVYFDNFGTVDRVANYTLKDGKVINLASSQTAPARGDESFLQQFFRGVGASKAQGTPGGT